MRKRVRVAAGDLDQRVEIEQMIDTVSEYSAPIQTPLVVGKRWAAILPRSGREMERATQPIAIATHVVRMRPFSGLTNKHRFRHARTGRILQIVNIRNLAFANVLDEVDCIELAA